MLKWLKKTWLQRFAGASIQMSDLGPTGREAVCKLKELGLVYLAEDKGSGGLICITRDGRNYLKLLESKEAK